LKAEYPLVVKTDNIAGAAEVEILVFWCERLWRSPVNKVIALAESSSVKDPAIFVVMDITVVQAKDTIVVDCSRIAIRSCGVTFENNRRFDSCEIDWL
jgi:hypothetical protein